MTRINTTKLIVQATDFADRTNFVRKDPAVVKAWKEASSDIRQAARTTTVAVAETRAAWDRSGYRGLRAAHGL